MARQTISNGESGLDVRNKLNSNFTEVYTDFGANGPINWLPSSTGDGTARRNILSTAPSNHVGDAWAAVNVEVEAPGSEGNGPTNADYGQVISVAKAGYASGTAASGEIDGLTIFVRQDGPDGLPSFDPDSSDAAAILVNAQNIGTSGFIASFEGFSSNLNRGTFAVDFGIRTQIGALDMNGVGANKFGFGAIADAGVITAAFLANTNGGSFTNILQSPGVVISAIGNYATPNSFWAGGAWSIGRSAPENGATEFTHRGTGALFFNTPEGSTLFSTEQIGVNTLTPDPAALLDLSSTTKGLLLPRMTTMQRDAIAAPPDGLQIYNSTTSKFQGRAGGSWVDLH